jgi:hypothetical protein
MCSILMNVLLKFGSMSQISDSVGSNRALQFFPRYCTLDVSIAEFLANRAAML